MGRRQYHFIAPGTPLKEEDVENLALASGFACESLRGLLEVLRDCLGPVADEPHLTRLQMLEEIRTLMAVKDDSALLAALAGAHRDIEVMLQRYGYRVWQRKVPPHRRVPFQPELVLFPDAEPGLVRAALELAQEDLAGENSRGDRWGKDAALAPLVDACYQFWVSQKASVPSLTSRRDGSGDYVDFVRGVARLLLESPPKDLRRHIWRHRATIAPLRATALPVLTLGIKRS